MPFISFFNLISSCTYMKVSSSSREGSELKKAAADQRLDPRAVSARYSALQPASANNCLQAMLFFHRQFIMVVLLLLLVANLLQKSL